jgi:hypothetical protein
MAQTGDAVALFQTLMSATWYGVVGDGATPGGMAATMECINDEAVITTDVLVGPKGEPGKPSPIVKLQWPALEQAADLEPIRPTLGEGDAGKAWWIGTVVHVWDGKTFQMVRPGPAGPAGATPQISFSAETIPMADRVPGMKDEVIQSGTSLNPNLHFKLLSPEGPRGPSTNILGAPDYDGSGGAPEDGQTLVWSEAKQKWQPSDYAAKQPRLYSVPEAAFTSTPAGVTLQAQRFSLLSYTVEEQDFAWTPYVTGHLKAFGVELDGDPLQIGCEVKLEAQSGEWLVGRGHGTILSWTTILPHFSSPGDTAAAVAPDNGVALVQAGERATITINLYNDGLLGGYVFNRSGAQVSILVIPQGG